MELSRRTFCVGAGVSTLLYSSAAVAGPLKRTQTSTVRTQDGVGRLQTRGGGTVKLHANVWPLPKGTSHAVICIHGIERNSADYFSYIKESLALYGGQALCIAPLFPKSAEIASDHYWQDGSWNSGGKDDGPIRYSGFSAIDDLIELLQAERITIVGHSAGGQFAHRYALSTLMQQEMHAVVSNPSSYTYLTSVRPNLAEDGYLLPSIAGYDSYRYGLSSSLNTYLSRQSVSAMRDKYLNRRVSYLLGDADTNPTSSTLDTSQQASTQGAHRFERGCRYVRYLNDHFSGHAHELTIVRGVGHSGRGMITSLPGQKVIFGS